MRTDRSLESLRAEVEELRARFARMQAEDRHQRRALAPRADGARRRASAAAGAAHARIVGVVARPAPVR
jgi:hypothetical protein